MTVYTEKKCPECGQQLRFPKDIGGMLMACPSCGKEFSSDFKIRVARESVQKGIARNIFEMPSRIVAHIGRYFTS